MKKLFAAVLLSLSTAAVYAVPFGSSSVLVVEDGTGKILLEKNANAIVPIASLTKLMTAMVILDAKQDMDEKIEIDTKDVDMLKHSTSRVPVGASIPRRDVLQLALMSSDNRAAASLGRTYPGGIRAFKFAVKNKIAALQMTQTTIEEPTGLSPHNISTASDLVKMATAAAHYPEITRITTDTKDIININGRGVEYHNTNRLVGAAGWDIGMSKTGYTEEAGRCLIMRITAAGKNATLVLLNAGASSVRVMDALNIRRFMSAGAATAATASAEPSIRTPRLRAGLRAPAIRASSTVKVSSAARVSTRKQVRATRAVKANRPARKERKHR
jgi:D-alanyl-D-alanine endopeptidase (penicillin-binding protein 7)